VLAPVLVQTSLALPHVSGLYRLVALLLRALQALDALAPAPDRGEEVSDRDTVCV
jgi:hypothetical protein